jgi:hypothetical protein
MLPSKKKFDLSAKQVEANHLLGSAATHILLRGGARSGKTLLLCRAIIQRALKASGSTHAIFRHRFNHLKASIIFGTMPFVIENCYPGLLPSNDEMLNKTDWFLELPNGSCIYYGGLDDKLRTEKILGQEHATIYLNECSQISYSARNMAMTRLAQKTLVDATGLPLALKAYYDCNPPTTGHWTYGLFMQGVEPLSRKPHANPRAFATLQINPWDNLDNLPPETIAILEALPERERKRFLEGEFLPAVVGALWTLDHILRVQPPKNDTERDALIQKMRRICIAIDPSGCSGPEDKRSDEIGILVCGKGEDGNGYVLEDASGHYSPEQWGKIAVELFDKWEADIVVGESNFGGEMVRATARVHRRSLPFKLVRASKGKAVRAEPISAHYALNKVFHVGAFPDLENQMLEFTAAGFQGEKSPDRADSMVFALTELMGKGTVGPAGVVGIY